MTRALCLVLALILTACAGAPTLPTAGEESSALVGPLRAVESVDDIEPTRQHAESHRGRKFWTYQLLAFAALGYFGFSRMHRKSDSSGNDGSPSNSPYLCYPYYPYLGYQIC